MSDENENGTDASHVMEQKVQKEIAFKLTAQEKNQMADTAAKLSRERDEKIEELKKIQKAMRDDIKAKQKEIDRLLDCHINGTEMRDVEVTERFDWDNKNVQYFHEGEMIIEREMMDSELQMKLGTTAKKVVKDKRTKAQKNPDLNLTPEELKSKEIAEVHRLETGKKTKKSALDQELN